MDKYPHSELRLLCSMPPYPATESGLCAFSIENRIEFSGVKMWSVALFDD